MRHFAEISGSARPMRLLLPTLVLGCGLASRLVIGKLHLLFDPDYANACTLGNSVGCNVVQSSAYASAWGHPISLWALATYLFLLLLSATAYRLKVARDTAALLLAAVAVAICLYSSYLAFIAAFVIRAFCIDCGAIYLINAAILGCCLASLRRAGGMQKVMASAWARPRQLSLVLALGAIGYGAILGASAAGYAGMRAQFKAQRIEVVQALLSARTTPHGLAYYHAPIDESDFTAGPSDARVTIVQFGDFDCPYCYELYENSKRLRDEYSAEVRWVFKHFPMNRDCNPMVDQAGHANACISARAASCAARQGLFWPMHDLLFERQWFIDHSELREHAAAIGADLRAFNECFEAPEPDEILQRHLDQARAAKIVKTPTTFINGHLVPGVIASEILEYYIVTLLAQPEDLAPPIRVQARDEAVVRFHSLTHSFSIDAYEASIRSDGIAVTAPGLPPSTGSWLDANRACRAAGKRLCSQREWMRACSGSERDSIAVASLRDGATPPRVYVYGPFHRPDVCRDGEADLEDATAEEDRLTGSRPLCVSPEGVYDMIGSLSEWTGQTLEDARLMDTHRSLDSTTTCFSARTPARRPWFQDATSGFRCCVSLDQSRAQDATHSP